MNRDGRARISAGEELSELLGEHGGGLLVGEVDLVDRVSAVLEGDVVVVDVRREEDF